MDDDARRHFKIAEVPQSGRSTIDRPTIATLRFHANALDRWRCSGKSRREAAEELFLRARKQLTRRGFTAHSLGVLRGGRRLSNPEQSQHAALAILGERVEGLPSGGEVDLEVARMDDDANRRIDGERDAINEAVRRESAHANGPRKTRPEQFRSALSHPAACVLRACLNIARVNSVPYTGTFSSERIHGSPLMWSPCPCGDDAAHHLGFRRGNVRNTISTPSNSTQKHQSKIITMLPYSDGEAVHAKLA